VPGDVGDDEAREQPVPAQADEVDVSALIASPRSSQNAPAESRYLERLIAGLDASPDLLALEGVGLGGLMLHVTHGSLRGSSGAAVLC
jgi:hypothetical protein